MSEIQEIIKLLDNKQRQLTKDEQYKLYIYLYHQVYGKDNNNFLDIDAKKTWGNTIYHLRKKYTKMLRIKQINDNKKKEKEKKAAYEKLQTEKEEEELKAEKEAEREAKAAVEAAEEVEREAKAVVEAAEIKAKKPVITGANVKAKVNAYEPATFHT